MTKYLLMASGVAGLILSLATPGTQNLLAGVAGGIFGLGLAKWLEQRGARR